MLKYQQSISFHFRLFPRKTNDKIFQKLKKIKKISGGGGRGGGQFRPLSLNLVKNEFSLKRGQEGSASF